VWIFAKHVLEKFVEEDTVGYTYGYLGAEDDNISIFKISFP
jgi:hypothetical protein